MRALVTTILVIIPSAPAWGEQVGGAEYFGASFGEIPVLAESFKPSVTWIKPVGNTGWGIRTTLQRADHIRRDGESFNARIAGLEGLQSSRESTGARHLIALNHQSGDVGLNLFVGALYSGKDQESIYFDDQMRTLAESHSGDLDITISRPEAVRFVCGVGYRYKINTTWSVTMDIAADLLGGVPGQEVTMGSNNTLSEKNRSEIIRRFQEAYHDNIHNRYHQFTIAIQYRL